MEGGKITPATLIPIGVLVIAIGLTVAATTFVVGTVSRVGVVEKDQAQSSGRLAGVETKIDAMAKDVAEVALTLRERSNDFVTLKDLKTWRKQLAHDNPTLLIPEVDK